MAVLNKPLTLDEVREDITCAVKTKFGMTVPELLDALQSHKMSASRHTDEVLMWLQVMPTDDPIFKPCYPQK